MNTKDKYDMSEWEKSKSSRTQRFFKFMITPNDRVRDIFFIVVAVMLLIWIFGWYH